MVMVNRERIKFLKGQRYLGCVLAEDGLTAVEVSYLTSMFVLVGLVGSRGGSGAGVVLWVWRTGVYKTRCDRLPGYASVFWPS